MDPQKPRDSVSDALDEKLRDLRVDEEAGVATRAPGHTRPGPASTSLLSLPEEILSEICEAVLEEYIDGKRLANYRSDLIRLAKTCKLFYAIVQPILYREITTNGPILVTGERFRTIDLEKLVRSPPWQPGVVTDSPANNEPGRNTARAPQRCLARPARQHPQHCKVAQISLERNHPQPASRKYGGGPFLS